MSLAETWAGVSCRITPILKDMNLVFVFVPVNVRLRCGMNWRLSYGWCFSVRKTGLPRKKCRFHTAYVLRPKSSNFVVGMDLAHKVVPFRNGIGL